MRKKALGQLFRIRQPDEMTAGDFLNLLSEPLTRDTSLKFDREKTVVSSRKNMNGDVGPALEATGLAENGLGFPRGCSGPACSTSCGTSCRKYVPTSNSVA
jgi:hypothetical protein